MVILSGRPQSTRHTWWPTILGWLAAALPTGCSDSTGVAGFAFDTVAAERIRITLSEGTYVARFCGCPPCVAMANSLSGRRRESLSTVLFRGTAESLAEFSSAVQWPGLRFVEEGPGWDELFNSSLCPQVRRVHGNELLPAELSEFGGHGR